MSQPLKRLDCAKVSEKMENERVLLKGWVNKRRDHGGLIFVDLRDRSGIVQLVFNQDQTKETLQVAESIRNEYVLSVEGTVLLRDEAAINDKMATGRVEVLCDKIHILNEAKTPVFDIADDIKVDENIRLRYRYLDLRRPVMQKNLRLRHQVTMAMRRFLDDEGFYEIETPMLTKSTPEGARDYLVPSRLNPAEFFALPQSPQIFKQLLMVSGMEKYFQIARCFRDEDLRADRQPEFTQLDMELSFVDQEDVKELIERMMKKIFASTMDKPLTLPFPIITYQEAMEKYGSDRPDLRFDMPLISVDDLLTQTDFKVFSNVLASGGQIKGIKAPGCAGYSRRDIDALMKITSTYGAKGLAWIALTEEGIKSPIKKFLNQEEIEGLKARMEAEEGDLLLFVADQPAVVAAALGALRLEFGYRLSLIDPEVFNFCWVVDFPLFEYDAEEDRYAAIHHMFTAPKDEDLDLLDTDPLSVRAKAYDLILNGIELGGGSIRIHRRDLQKKIFDLVGFSQEEAKEKFGFLLDAFEYGAPPHGGVAFGLDRMIMLMNKEESIRDVIAFPKTQSASDLLVDAPSPVVAKQLDELHIKVKKKDPKKA